MARRATRPTDEWLELTLPGRPAVVQELRASGHHDKADQAEKKLPHKVKKDEHKGLLDRSALA
jgi:hypothetical protein